MQITSPAITTIRAMPIELEPDYPIHAPYLERLHYSKPRAASHMHYHASCEIGLCRQGSGIFYIGNQIHRYSTGDVSVIAPGVIHIAQSDPGNISGWQFLDIDFSKMLAALPREYSALLPNDYSGIVHPSDEPLLGKLVAGILEEMQQKRPCARQMVRLLAAETAIVLERLSLSKGRTSIVPENLHEISPAVLHMVNHYASPVTLRELALMCSRSESAFRRAFERIMGVTPFEFLYQVRIKAAINLLQNTSLPVSEIAAATGYQTLSSFNRHFRRITGKTPRSCRGQV